MLLIVILFGIGNLLFGEIITVSDGFGWDGKGYRDIARDFSSRVLEKMTLVTIPCNEFVPSLIVHYGLRLLQTPIIDKSILMGFRVLNFTLVVIAVYVYIFNRK